MRRCLWKKRQAGWGSGEDGTGNMWWGRTGSGGDRSGCVEPGCDAAQSGRAGPARGQTGGVRMAVDKEGAQSCCHGESLVRPVE